MRACWDQVPLLANTNTAPDWFVATSWLCGAPIARRSPSRASAEPNSSSPLRSVAISVADAANVPPLRSYT